MRSSRAELDGDPDDVLQNAAGVLVFSERLQRALGPLAAPEVQYLPIRVFKHDGACVGTFSIANTLTLLPALDRRRSRFSVWGSDRPGEEDGIRSITQPILVSSIVSGHHIFRLLEYPWHAYVSESIKAVFEEHRFTGLSFDEVGLDWGG
jgi:hypothetical protein